MASESQGEGVAAGFAGTARTDASGVVLGRAGVPHVPPAGGEHLPVPCPALAPALPAFPRDVPSLQLPVERNLSGCQGPRLSQGCRACFCPFSSPRSSDFASQTRFGLQRPAGSGSLAAAAAAGSPKGGPGLASALQTPAHGCSVQLRASLNEATHHPHRPATGLYWVQAEPSCTVPPRHNPAPSPKRLSPTKTKNPTKCQRSPGKTLMVTGVMMSLPTRSTPHQ